MTHAVNCTNPLNTRVIADHAARASAPKTRMPVALHELRTFIDEHTTDGRSKYDGQHPEKPAFFRLETA